MKHVFGPVPAHVLRFLPRRTETAKFLVIVLCKLTVLERITRVDNVETLFPIQHDR